MASITHAFVSTQAQGANPALASKNEWNAAHNLAYTVHPITGADSIALANDVVTLAAGTYPVTVPAATGSGKSILVTMNGAGAVTLNRSGSDTIGGDTSFVLNGQGDWCVLADEAAGVWGLLSPRIKSGNAASAQLAMLVQPQGTQTVAMAGGTTTLTNASPRQLILTGSGILAQTVVLPAANTLPFVDWAFEIDNTTTGLGVITVQANGGGFISYVKPGENLHVNATSIATAAGTWEPDIMMKPAQLAQLMVRMWTAWGHSLFMNGIGTYDQTGRFDCLARSMLGLSTADWNNLAINGARISADALISQGRGGWHTVAFNTQYRGTKTTPKTSPYTASGGGHMMCFGLNDIGNYGNSTQQQTAFIHGMRFAISRCRASTVRDNADASVAYGAGMTALTGQEGRSTTGTLRNATSTTNANFTITIPADYKGEKIAICLIGRPGVTGGVVTWSGTAGLTGTLSCSNIKASADAVTCPVVVRYTAPITGGTQTIIGTVTTVDSSGNVSFDSWWLESLSPSPVVVCNISRMSPIGHAAIDAASYYAPWKATSNTAANRDTDVLNWNIAIRSLLAEFDSMVQEADCDGAIGASDQYYSPNAPAGVHYNEIGSAKASQALVDAVNRLSPSAYSYGNLACMAGSPPARGSVQNTILPGNYYFSPGAKISAATYTCVAGDMFAVPFRITQGNTRFTAMGFECTNAPTTGTTVRLAVFFDDANNPGRPGTLISEKSAGVAVGTSAGFKSATGLNDLEFDPGLYWLVMKINQAPTTVPIFRQIDGPVSDMPSLTTAGLPISGVLGPVGWKLTGQANAVFGPVWPSGAVMVASAPHIAMLSAVPG
jgi:hypothetical protein